MIDSIIQLFFVVFVGSALLAVGALYARQAMILGYILLGVLCGPSGFDLFPQTQAVTDLGEVGIMFLLYLLGLNLYPQKLIKMLGEALSVTLVAALACAAVGALVAQLAGLSLIDTAFVAVCTAFSSTILGLKLLPTTALHHRHAGEIVISVLLLQDLIAIIVLVSISAIAAGSGDLTGAALPLIGLPLVVLVGFAAKRWLLTPLIERFDTIQEFVFLVAIAWCLGLAQFGHMFGLTYEVGAVVAGVVVATSNIARFIAEQLRPLRDFFLVVFFFSLGASTNVNTMLDVLIPSLGLAVAVLIGKPLVFGWLLTRHGEPKSLSQEIGLRLGQMSEFSLLVAALAALNGIISEQATALITTTTLLTLVASSHLIVSRVPNPIATDPKLRRD
ncbi:MAG: sodium:hydrogen antiporter [Lysobacteraceae bacterium]|nr:MAG: sodium:hydrogen antiporter [Xanthomonadaceae bacterium]